MCSSVKHESSYPENKFCLSTRKATMVLLRSCDFSHPISHPWHLTNLPSSLRSQRAGLGQEAALGEMGSVAVEYGNAGCSGSLQVFVLNVDSCAESALKMGHCHKLNVQVKSSSVTRWAVRLVDGNDAARC